MRGTLRVAFVGSPDLRELLLGDPGADPGRAHTSTLSTTPHMELSELPPQGWTSTLGSLRSDGTDPFDVLVTSATAELDDPSREPADALIELTRFVGERRHAPVVVLNASTLLLGPDTVGGLARDAEPLDVRIRRLDLATMEASKATGLSVLDADRLVAEMRLPVKVRGVLGYAPEVDGVLRTALSSILRELGYADRPVMGVRVPSVGPIANLSVERWLKSEGDVVGSGDVICEIRLSGLRRVRHITNALVLASIKRQRAIGRSTDLRPRSDQTAEVR